MLTLNQKPFKLIGKEMKPEDEIQVTANTRIVVPSFIKGYHIYRNVWLPLLVEELYGKMDPCNPVDKYAVAVKKTINWQLDSYHWVEMVNL